MRSIPNFYWFFYLILFFYEYKLVGKCSICGEDYAKPKRFEKGGDLYRGYIVRSYAQKDRIKAKVEVSLGYSAGFLY